MAQSRVSVRKAGLSRKIETVAYVSGNCLFLREMQAVSLSSLVDSKLFYGSLRLCLVVVNELLAGIQEINLKDNFMRMYLKSIGFLEESRQKFLELTDFYKDASGEISFGQNNAAFCEVDYLRLFNQRSPTELRVFVQKFMDDELFTRRVYTLRELYLAKRSFNAFMFELLENLSEQAKEKIALGLGQSVIDVVDVRSDAEFLKRQFRESLGSAAAEKHLSVEKLGDLDEVDLEGEEIVFALLQTEENVGFWEREFGIERRDRREKG